MTVKASYVTSLGVIEGIIRLVIIGLCSWILFRVYQNPAPFFRSPNDELIAGVWLLIVMIAELYNMYRLFNVFFQSISYEKRQLVVCNMFRKKTFQRDDFHEMWLSAYVPKLDAWFLWPGVWRSWDRTNFNIGFDSKSETKGEYRIGRAWDKKELQEFIKVVNNS
jgi:hypothetical protein